MKKEKSLNTLLGEGEKLYSTGRRKEAKARVWITRGTGKVFINRRELSEYFASPVLRSIVNQPFAAANESAKYDVWCTVKGSGLSGQAGAIRHGISRALVEDNADLRPALKTAGFLTRDARTVERKKPGLRKARKRPQWKKR